MLSSPPASHPHIPPSRRTLALTLLTRTRNPSQLARALYLSPATTPHPFLSGAPAEDLGGLPPVDNSYFYTAARWREHRRGLGLPEDDARAGEEDEERLLDMMPKGTVGAVALDVRGCIAVCTSTGGRTNKLPGRIGDTPHYGAGFWAEEWIVQRPWWAPRWWRSKVRAVGVSGTGDGDVRLIPHTWRRLPVESNYLDVFLLDQYFIRQNTAATLARRVQYLGEPLHRAARWVVDALDKEHGAGGVIALDDEGNGKQLATILK